MANDFTEYLFIDLDRVQGVDPSHGCRPKLTKNPNG